MSEGKLQKLVIRCFKDERFQEELLDLKYTALLNPETYSFSFKADYQEEQAQGTSGDDPKFVRSLPEDLTLDFLFDRTGVIIHYGDDPLSSSGDTVYKDQGNGIIDDLDAFKKAVYDYNGDKHKPNYLIITWGSLSFRCFLTSMDVEYKLFKPDGTPLRAMVKATFKRFIEAEERVAEENNNSPDLTHYRVVKAGDTLPLMTYRIYGDPKYYLEVARVNNISNFRKLKVGQELFFPPLQKQS
ncbi:CIS tube protein [Aquimarina spongiae]|uniref:Nucleoid-associated protein YgaU, contains BON and LysM domains n=1 Tax=Aquimarina spongiae TaxID=570521 RepID=A0A1M6IWA6_9FLAO|nr:hypothetical protein [Aquimarina spongiae]SHJ38731.1 Nucleoid-associated protein YgaU, contains BON and LysM domains [Aquimarina spongiae]